MGEISVVKVFHTLEAGHAVKHGQPRSQGSPVRQPVLLVYLDEIEQKRRLKHPVQFDVLVPQQVLQAASGAVLRHHCKHGAVGEEAEERVHVLISQVLHLRKQEKLVFRPRKNELIPFFHLASLSTFVKILVELCFTSLNCPSSNFFSHTQSPWKRCRVVTEG